MFTAYYIKFECSVKDFIIKTYIYATCVHWISFKQKKGEVSCNAFSVFLLTLNLKEIHVYNELTYSKTWR